SAELTRDPGRPPTRSRCAAPPRRRHPAHRLNPQHSTPNHGSTNWPEPQYQQPGQRLGLAVPTHAICTKPTRPVTEVATPLVVNPGPLTRSFTRPGTAIHRRVVGQTR